MTSYSVPGDTVPDDGYPYYADLCPTCQEPRPFRLEDDDDGETTGTCAIAAGKGDHASANLGNPSLQTVPESTSPSTTSESLVFSMRGSGDLIGCVAVSLRCQDHKRLLSRESLVRSTRLTV